MYRTLRLALVTTLLAATALSAHAGRLPGPSTSPAGGIDPITTSSSGQVDSPGDPFIPEVNTGGTTPRRLAPPAIDCWVALNEDGIPTIYLTNVTNKKYPKGTEVEVVLGDGTHYGLSNEHGWLDAGTSYFTMPKYDGPLTIDCTLVLPEEVAK